MTINITVPSNIEAPDMKPRITVFGVGGAGGNAVNNMIQSQLEGVDFVVANTDAQSLSHSRTDRRVQLGTNITRGLGAGSRPEVGQAAAEEAIEDILAQFVETNMAFITAGRNFLSFWSRTISAACVTEVSDTSADRAINATSLMGGSLFHSMTARVGFYGWPRI